MNKQETAMELFTTYGWAFLVIIVMIGALAYFGVLSPSEVSTTYTHVDVELSDYTCAEMDYGIKFEKNFLKEYNITHLPFRNDIPRYYEPIEVLQEINTRCMNQTKLNITVGDLE